MNAVRKMKVNGRKIIENLHQKGCHPTKTNFGTFCREVEEFLLLELGAENHENVTKKSIENITKASDLFTKSSKNIWDKYGRL